MDTTTTESPPAQLAAALATLLSATMNTEHNDGDVMLRATAHGRSFLITVAEHPVGGAIDPLAHVNLGDKINRPRSGDKPRCAHGFDTGRTCSREDGHPGQHISWARTRSVDGGAQDEGVVVEIKVNTSAPTTGDPVVERYLAGLRECDHVMRGVYGDHFSQQGGTNCGERRGAWTCTRKPGHTGVHVATTSDRMLVCDAWGGESGGPVDERALWRGVKRGSRLTAVQAAQMATGYSDQCDEESDHGYDCSRKHGHDGPCIATYEPREGGEVCCVPFNKPWAPMTGRLWRWGSPDPTGGPDEHDPCGEDIEGDKCTRGDGHDGRHVSGNGEYVLDSTEE